MTNPEAASATELRTAQSGEQPRVLVVGDLDVTTRAVERTLDQLDVQVVHIASVQAARDALSRSALAVVLVHPLPEGDTIDAVAALAPRSTPVFIVVPETFGDTEARRLYETGAAAVFAWPNEALVLPAMLADLADALPHRPSDADARLTRVVHARVAQRVDGDVDVQVVGGTARVTGRVPSFWAKQRLETILSHVPGITGVSTSKLRVVPEQRSDDEVLRAAQSLLSCLSGVDPKTVSVNVEDGILSIAGSVGSHEGLERLQSVLGNLEGVRDLHDHVVVSSAATRRAHDLATRLEEDLQGIWPGSEVSVTVFGDIAVLTGHTKTLANKRAIAGFVADTDGIARVVNKLAVVAAVG